MSVFGQWEFLAPISKPTHREPSVAGGADSPPLERFSLEGSQLLVLHRRAHDPVNQSFIFGSVRNILYVYREETGGYSGT